MTGLTLQDLRLILVECAGQDETGPLDEAGLDTPFTDLGYDSLALQEAAAVASLRLGVPVADDIADARTPREFLRLVNECANTVRGVPQ
jgi:act minimal PKS acyl carrier protein